ncbi:hypothetical protein MVEN_00158700 [Mycena venus]|uniref:F-box domain-containing protein n=1 Tax=Mycena venus TaxID=2733690 RepID=A0A8H6YWG9_9AGAR|nr:hypothetical protein MVEN_00158700 [Mycena venus]
MASLLPLPLDLLFPIVTHITKKQTLLRLCHVSKSFLHEAQWRLFADVPLQSGDVVSFCRTVSASPRLALAVRRLSIQLADDFAEIEELAHALRLLANLRALEIIPPQPESWPDVLVRTRENILAPWKHSAAAGRILQVCSFRLRVFRSAFRMGDANLLDFLYAQSEIEELGSFSTTESEVITLKPQMLPRLKKFSSAVTHLHFETGVDLEGKPSRREFLDERMDVQVLMGSYEFSFPRVH